MAPPCPLPVECLVDAGLRELGKPLPRLRQRGELILRSHNLHCDELRLARWNRNVLIFRGFHLWSVRFHDRTHSPERSTSRYPPDSSRVRELPGSRAPARFSTGERNIVGRTEAAAIRTAEVRSYF